MNLPAWKIRVEVTMIRQAHEMVFLTTLYLFNAQEACAMAMVGADIIVAHMGLTTASALGAKMAASLEDSVRHVLVIMDVASEVDPDVIVLCHGGLSLWTNFGSKGSRICTTENMGSTRVLWSIEHGTLTH